MVKKKIPDEMVFVRATPYKDDVITLHHGRLPMPIHTQPIQVARAWVEEIGSMTHLAILVYLLSKPSGIPVTVGEVSKHFDISTSITKSVFDDIEKWDLFSFSLEGEKE